MKRYAWMIAAAMVAVTLGTGCGNKGEVNTSKLESSFQSAPPANRSQVDQAVQAIKEGNYSQAMTDLQKLASQAKLTPEQQQAIQDVLAQVQKQMAEAAGKAANDAQKAAENAKKSLPLGH